MCGIFAYAGNKNKASEIVFDGLKSLEYRGYDSWGVAVKDEKNKIHIQKQVGKIGKGSIKKSKSSFGMGHTRWATHGGVTKANSHPHTDCGREIVIIHNGIVENYQAIKEQFQNKHKFTSETDTEIVAHLIEEELGNKSFVDAVKSAYAKLDGLSAIIVFHKKHDVLVAIRKGSPLAIGFGNKQNFITSDPAALLPHTKKVYFMEDDELAEVSKSGVRITDLNTNKIKTPKVKTLSWKVNAGDKGGFDHFMLKEMLEQPHVMGQVLKHSQYLSQAKNLIKKSDDVYALGCGTASYAAIAAGYIFSQIAGKEVKPRVGSEFKSLTPTMGKNSLVVALSQSGETMDTLEAIKAAKQKNTPVLSLVNVVGSTLYRQSDVAIPLLAGPEKAVASTKAFIAKLTYFFALAHLLKENPITNTSDLMLEKKNLQYVLNSSSRRHIEKIAQKFKKSPNMFVIGRGLSYPAALETALKIKEISYIHAEGLAGGELKHGVIALIEKGTPCVVFAPIDDQYTDSITSAMELKARGAHIIGVSPSRSEAFDTYIPIKSHGPEALISNVAVGQLLSYYLAVAKNLDPDMPRNLAKSVTVK